MIREVEYKATPGLMVILVLVVGELLALGALVRGAQQGRPGQAVLALVLFTLLTVFFKGIFVVNPNEARVITLFGRYIGSEKRAGLWFANPFTARKRISLRVRNFETTKLKVNDANSNPTELGAIVAWKVDGPAQGVAT